LLQLVVLAGVALLALVTLTPLRWEHAAGIFPVLSVLALTGHPASVPHADGGAEDEHEAAR